MAVIYTRNRISAASEMLMGAVAWAAYGINFLVNILGDWFGIGEIVSFIFMALVYCMFAFWFATKGVSVFKGKIAGAAAGKFVLSLIPIVNVFAFSRTKKGLIEPSVRAFVRQVTEITREEDDVYNQKQINKISIENASSDTLGDTA
ncbi:MAG TPA: hypothetical protein VFA52_03415 [Candidatus Paceibacterota bacterium]|nr:hypothetical protein [Candidatus Paceibacterota bacterium]